MGRMYAWATPSYLLNKMPLTLILKYYVEGIAFEEYRAVQQANMIGRLFSEEKDDWHSIKDQKPKVNLDEPDRTALYARFGDRIKHPLP